VFNPAAKWGHPVRKSQDFDRIYNLPIKQPFSGREKADMVRSLTKTGSSLEIWPRQLQALLEAKAVNGLFAPIPVGGGKTLVCLLLPTVLNKRAIILTTPSLIAQMKEEREKFSKHFKIRDDLEIHPYSMLSNLDRYEEVLQCKPELIVADECHCLKSSKASRTSRFLKYMRKNPETLFAGLSGTVTKRSILDFAHLLILALRENAPIPLRWSTLQEWAEALDVSDFRRPPGALLQFCKEGQDVREGYHDRLHSCMGVVSGEEVQLSAVLEIVEINRSKCKIIEDMQQKIWDTWETPDGECLMYMLQVYNIIRQVRLGGYYRLKWEKDVSETNKKAWLDSKRRFQRDVQIMIRDNPTKDCALAVLRACEEDQSYLPSYKPWCHVRDRVPKPDKEWVFLDKNWILDEVKKHLDVPTIVWTDVVAVGEHLAKSLGLSYHGDGDNTILKTDGTKSIVASIQAHGTGRNLQHFSNALVVGGTPTGLLWEQLLGRLHRPGQCAKVVTYKVLFPEEVQAAMKDAEYLQKITGPQKLLLAKRRQYEQD